MTEQNDRQRQPHEHVLVDGKSQCPVIQLAIDRFGLTAGMWLLWEETCFPMSDEIALAQLKQLIARADNGEVL